MRLALTGRNLEVTPALRLLVTRRLAKLDRLLHDGIISAQVVLRMEKHRHKTDVLVQTRGDHALNGHGEDANWPASVGSALAKVEQQAARVKGKWEAKKRRVDGAGRRAAADGVEAEEPARPAGVASAGRPVGRRRTTTAAPDRNAAQPRVIRVRRTRPKPMRLEDAVLRVDTPPGSVVVFRDSALDRVQVLVRRGDGHIGLVDLDA